ncbi:MAG: ArnT family glycosyltransferase, partial [Candidatus Methylopumilus sp.]
AFEIDHDWQGNLATPRARIGEVAKTRLLIILCCIWICLGLVGHQPWKPNESASISIIKSMLAGEHLLDPVAVGETTIKNPPLYYLSATTFSKVLSPILNTHDAARIASGFWMALTLLLTGMIGRELWGLGMGRQTTFIMLSSIGLITTAHLLMPEVSALTGSAMAFYGLALAKRRPFRASVLLGMGMGISFMSTGLMTAAISLLTAIVLPIFFKAWRSKSYAIVLGLASITLAPWVLLWPALVWHISPSDLSTWWHHQIQLTQLNHLYLIRTLSWFAWPALPIAGWGIWRFRSGLLFKPKFQLMLTFFLIAFLIIGLKAKNSDVAVLTLLIPLVAMASGSAETLKRGAAGALNWFGLVLFGLMGILIWLGWIAIMTGHPAKLSARMHILSGLSEAHINIPALMIALFISLIWLITINAKRSNRAAVTDWAVGITMAWSLLMALWLPMIDSAKSYQGVMLSLQQALPAKPTCINSLGFGQAQQALLDYYTDLRVMPLKNGAMPSCHLFLVQEDKNHANIILGEDWKIIWQGNRPADRHEKFTLYQKTK